MSKFAIRLLTPASYAAALVVVPAVNPRPVGRAWPVTRSSSQAGAACPAKSEASTVGCGLLQSMTILTEKFRALMAAKP
jgi:hypothetical protein